MKLHGRRILIAGSADIQTPETDLFYAHKLIRELAHDLVAKGASFVISFGREPRLKGREDGPSIIFDWTVAESIHSALVRRTGAILWDLLENSLQRSRRKERSPKFRNIAETFTTLFAAQRP